MKSNQSDAQMAIKAGALFTFSVQTSPRFSFCLFNSSSLLILIPDSPCILIQQNDSNIASLHKLNINFKEPNSSKTLAELFFILFERLIFHALEAEAKAKACPTAITHVPMANSEEEAEKTRNSLWQKKTKTHICQMIHCDVKFLPGINKL
jgi:hypothetical protein